MKYLEPYKLFESTEVGDEEVAELIEECKDIIETFNEAEDKFKIIRYGTGFIHNGFFGTQYHESDPVAIIFYLLSSNNLSDNISNDQDIITLEKTDDIIEMVNKSKLLIKRLSRYCEKIYYGMNQNSIKFTLEFTNPDKINSNLVKINRLYKKIKEGCEYFGKDMKLVNIPSVGVDRFHKRYKNFYELIKNNPNLIDDIYGKWDDTRDRTELTIRFDQKESIQGDSIIVNVSGFKYKTYRMTRFKNIKLSDEEREAAMKCIEYDTLSYLREDSDLVESSIEGNKIKIKVK